MSNEIEAMRAAAVVRSILDLADKIYFTSAGTRSPLSATSVARLISAIVVGYKITAGNDPDDVMLWNWVRKNMPLRFLREHYTGTE